MRSEKEMLDLILGYARGNEDVRAVIMNGSRVNPNVKKDPFQDYDIVYLVRSVEPYRRNPEIPRYFGEILILQTPEDMGDPPPANDGSYGYLMQFMDGTRIDLGFCPLEFAQRCIGDTLSVVLLDKDLILGEVPPPNESGYLPSMPTVKEFDDCCNEFWWLNPYVAKGLWRDQPTYARYMLDTLMREQLMKMLTWYFGMKTGFQRSPGYHGKYLRSAVGEDIWAMLEGTYCDARPQASWEALFVMGELFRQAGRAVASEFGFTYPELDDQNVSAYIRRIRALPRVAKTK
jgi:aminoglycoside 6-adenylyltransferase